MYGADKPDEVNWRFYHIWLLFIFIVYTNVINIERKQHWVSSACFLRVDKYRRIKVAKYNHSPDIVFNYTATSNNDLDRFNQPTLLLSNEH